MTAATAAADTGPAAANSGTPSRAGLAVAAASAGVLARYDELAGLLAGIEDRPAAEPALSAAAAATLLHEARLLDAGRFEEWLDGWTDDGVLWVPLSAHAHPGVDQSLLLDDRRRLAERVEWRRDPSAWGQHPPSRTTRIVGGVEAWPAPVGGVEAWPAPVGGGLVARSTLLIDEHRHHRHQQLAGFQIHELVGEGDRGGLRRRTKIVVIAALATGVRNPSFLL